MSRLSVRIAGIEDVPAMAALRTASGWTGGADAERMRRYLLGEHHPRHALAPRVACLAVVDTSMAGFIAGHLSTRFGCAGELQWLLVAPEFRGALVASTLLASLADWFVAAGAARVCVNVAPENLRARRFYARCGAVSLSPHWMVWDDIGVLTRGVSSRARAPSAGASE